MVQKNTSVVREACIELSEDVQDRSTVHTGKRDLSLTFSAQLCKQRSVMCLFIKLVMDSHLFKEFIIVEMCHRSLVDHSLTVFIPFIDTEKSESKVYPTVGPDQC